MDLIDRQAAIDAVSEGCQELRGVFAECEKNLNELPSAQPELIRCKDCKYFETAGNLLDGLCRRHRIPMTMYSTGFCSRAERRTDE